MRLSPLLSHLFVVSRHAAAVAGTATRAPPARRLRPRDEERRLLPSKGTLRTLIVRATDSNGVEPFSSAREEADVWFGAHDLTLGGLRRGILQNSVVRAFPCEARAAGWRDFF